MAKRKTKAPTTHEGAVDAKSTIQPRIYIEHPGIAKCYTVPLEDFLRGEVFTPPDVAIENATKRKKERHLFTGFANTLARSTYGYCIARCLRLDLFADVEPEAILSNYKRAFDVFDWCYRLYVVDRQQLADMQQRDASDCEDGYVHIADPIETALKWLTLEHKTLLPPAALYHALRIDKLFARQFSYYAEERLPRYYYTKDEKTVEFGALYFGKSSWTVLREVLTAAGLPLKKVKSLRDYFKKNNYEREIYGKLSRTPRTVRLVPLAQLYLHCAIAMATYLRIEPISLPVRKLKL